MYKELLLLLCMYKYITVNITEGHGQQKIWITGMLFFYCWLFFKMYFVFFFLGGGGIVALHLIIIWLCTTDLSVAVKHFSITVLNLVQCTKTWLVNDSYSLIQLKSKACYYTSHRRKHNLLFKGCQKPGESNADSG